ncbi:putative inorganic phosphate cotransporter isoform X2 [Cylas formicarius]|uniref:putative inorganic phosphate cotransporter isoform X2 n=1 Tax=Cylas formicarius TaxID=197179 RepID=UPI002958C977|nr:putative inorganic phosphate cotransporter isoform X2 [Cylas formicarius]
MNVEKFEIAEPGKTKPDEDSQKVPTLGVRHCQAFLNSLLVFLAYGVRVTLSVAIVAMTDPFASSNPNVRTYPEWTDKSVVLSAFFWGYVIPQIFAGWLAGQYGPKWFLIGSMGLCSLMSILIPSMAELMGSKGVMAGRVIQGFSQGFFFPSVHHVISQWVPPDERSRMGTIIYAAGPLGTVISMLVSGAISASSLGWPWVFYIYGVAGLVWCVLSFIFSANSPAVHPNISDAEKFYIENSLGHADEKPRHKTPWKAILKSAPVWAIVITQTGQNLGFWTLMTEIPNYMSHVMSFDIKSNSILSALPYFVLWILSFIMCFASDWLVNRGLLSRGATRKLFNTIGLVIPAIALIFLGYTPTDQPKRAVAFLVIAVGFNSGVYCGYNVNHVDLSPNHASTLMGISNGLSNISGILAPLLVQFLVTDETDPDQWKIIFFVTSGVYVIADIVFIIFGSGDIQTWNEDPKEEKGAKSP